MRNGPIVDSLIIGSGLAGLSTALRLAEAGRTVLVVSAASELETTNTVMAQGGIIFEGESRSPEKLMADIQEAGAHLNYVPAVRKLAEKGPDLVQEILLEKAGVSFDRVNTGEWHLTREGAHSESRILHRGDESGKAIEQALLKYVKHFPSVQMRSQTTAVNLLMTSFHSKENDFRYGPARCFGAFVFDQNTREVYPVFARDTVLATGGIGQLYLHNTNSPISRGDGIALAARVGCRLENLEYVQFHPTTFYHATAPRFLISEALRGEGAVLRDSEGNSFLERYLPQYQKPELAPRDKLAWAIHQHMLASEQDCVYLDLSHKPADWVKDRFPSAYQSCLKAGVDITVEPIPVVPAAHYHCGGVWTDLEGRTSVSHLSAVGEVACTGVHGANRLASTSLLESLVWGSETGTRIHREQSAQTFEGFPEIEPWKSESSPVDLSFIRQDWITLRHTMWNYVGLLKTESRLERADGILAELRRGIGSFYKRAQLCDDLIGLRHAVTVARLILRASQRNTESRGCYLRESGEGFRVGH